MAIFIPSGYTQPPFTRGACTRFSVRRQNGKSSRTCTYAGVRVHQPTVKIKRDSCTLALWVALPAQLESGAVAWARFVSSGVTPLLPSSSGGRGPLFRPSPPTWPLLPRSPPTRYHGPSRADRRSEGHCGPLRIGQLFLPPRSRALPVSLDIRCTVCNAGPDPRCT